MSALETKKIQELDKQMADIEAEIDKLQELINANDEKSKLIDNQSKQETDLEKRKELDIEFMKITRDTLALHREQSILSQKSNKLLIKKIQILKKLVKK